VKGSIIRKEKGGKVRGKKVDRETGSAEATCGNPRNRQVGCLVVGRRNWKKSLQGVHMHVGEKKGIGAPIRGLVETGLKQKVEVRQGWSFKIVEGERNMFFLLWKTIDVGKKRRGMDGGVIRRRRKQVKTRTVFWGGMLFLVISSPAKGYTRRQCCPDEYLERRCVAGEVVSVICNSGSRGNGLEGAGRENRGGGRRFCRNHKKKCGNRREVTYFLAMGWLSASDETGVRNTGIELKLEGWGGGERGRGSDRQGVGREYWDTGP